MRWRCSTLHSSVELMRSRTGSQRLGAHGEFSWNIVSSRGCPYACNWCAKPTFGRRYSVRSPEDVACEMLRLTREVQPDHLWFTDDILGLDVDWICAFADEVERAGA